MSAVPVEDDLSLDYWPGLRAAWVSIGGARVGWISEHPDHVNAYNADNWPIGGYPDLQTATTALSDERSREWRWGPVNELRASFGLPPLKGTPPPRGGEMP